jgi:hypothetical protein
MINKLIKPTQGFVRGAEMNMSMAKTMVKKFKSGRSPVEMLAVKKQRALAQLKKLKKIISKIGTTDTTWGHVVDVKFLNSTFKEAIQFASGDYGFGTKRISK